MSSEENEPTQAAANAEIRLEHERELFTVEDPRITALETQAPATWRTYVRAATSGYRGSRQVIHRRRSCRHGFGDATVPGLVRTSVMRRLPPRSRHDRRLTAYSRDARKQAIAKVRVVRGTRGGW